MSLNVEKPTAPAFEKASAIFRAKYLHALEPLIRASQDDIDHWTTSGLIIEPIAIGGAVLVATDGRTLAAIHDPSAAATRPMRVTIPDALFAAVAPPAGVAMYDQGDTFTMPLPEWAQPGKVYAWGLAGYVFPQMPHPAFDLDEGGLLASVSAETGKSYAGGYRIHGEPPTLAWRSILTKPRTGGRARFNVYPQMLGRFDRIERLAGNGIEIDVGSEGGPVILRTPGTPEFIGAVMPTTVPLEPTDLPNWLSASVSPPTPVEA